MPLNRELQDDPVRFEQPCRLLFAVTVQVHPVGISLLHIEHLDIGQRSRPSGECGVCLGTAEIRMEKKHKSLGHHQLQYSVGETMPKARKLFQSSLLFAT